MRRLISFMFAACVGGVASAQPAPDTLLIQGGYVMSMDPAVGDIDGGDVLIRAGRIVAIGNKLQAEGEVRRIDARGKVVLPGFIDVHSHLWTTTMRGQFRNRDGEFFPVSTRLAQAMTPQDLHTAMMVGALEQLQGGITTTGDFFDAVRSPAHGDAGLRALQDAGGRAVLFYGGPDRSTTKPIDLAHLRELASRAGPQSRVQLGLAWRLPRDRNNAENWAMRQQEFDTARELKLPIQVHVSGEAGPMFDALIQRKFLYPGLTVVHATDAKPEQLDALERAGGALALTPVSEHRVGYGLTRVDHFQRISRQGLGIDGNPLAGNADMFATLRLAALTWSGQARDEKAPDPRALLDLATRRGAAVLGMEKEIGTLAVGKRADLQVIDLAALNLSGFGGGDPASLLVYSAKPENVQTVLVEGRPIKLDGKLVGVDLPAVLQRANASAKTLLQNAPAK